MELITICRVNMRQYPSVAAPSLMVLERNAVLDFGTGEQEVDGLLIWARVQFFGIDGWVALHDVNERPLVDTFDDTDWGWCIRFVLWQEGGLSNDANDAGGTTKFGISQRFHPGVNVMGLTLDVAKQIYFTQYWQASKAYQYGWGLCLHHFDHAVNAGVGAASSALLASDGKVEAYSAYRRNFYRQIAGTDYQHSAWLRRVDCCDAEIKDRLLMR